MAAVESGMKKGSEEKSDVNHCSATSPHLIEHKDTDADDKGSSAVCHSVSSSKTDTKTGVRVGVASVLTF